MTTLTPGRNPAALLGASPGAGRVNGSGMRDLLRDTALLVTSIGSGGTIPDAAKFRERCRQLIQHFSDALERRGYPDDIRNEALLAQCGVLDETVLRHLPAESRASWELTPLQVERFRIHDAGEQVMARIEARLRETPAHADLLECYAAILGMGFRGRYARDGQARLAELGAALDARLATLRPSAGRPFMTDHAAHRFSDWLYRLSPWAMAGLACLAAAAVWGTWSVTLDTQLANVAPAKVSRP
ncbi:DotU family type IV/VI secretion system protein [Paraburkholderia ferrariae]|uniref:DotU family type IV/VI secretion system protein n=1 Tax=Paraburkholderia ferrariae TaxID=386056 RepID=UPI00047F2710|nr:DotU family type IV/VI secretion system protein [Paraburkholderia ferrariae]